MRISDWSSDVCSSDLKGGDRRLEPQKFLVPSAEYKTRKFGFVIDETRHVPFGPNTLPHAIDMLIENIRAQRADIERLTEASHQAGDQTIRSEEHTSELQSLMRKSYAVFCLKKKKHNKQHQQTD